MIHRELNELLHGVFVPYLALKLLMGGDKTARDLVVATGLIGDAPFRKFLRQAVGENLVGEAGKLPSVESLGLSRQLYAIETEGEKAFGEFEKILGRYRSGEEINPDPHHIFLTLDKVRILRSFDDGQDYKISDLGELTGMSVGRTRKTITPLKQEELIQRANFRGNPRFEISRKGKSERTYCKDRIKFVENILGVEVLAA